MQILNTLNIPLQDHITYISRVIDGTSVTDVRLSRVACHYVAMRADTKKPQVAETIQYFSVLAGAVQTYLEQVENAERVLIRSEVTEREKTLSSTAHAAGVTNFAYFQNARYLGLYNMSIAQLRKLRGIESKHSPLRLHG